jgi:GT2 family glycosyltransferase
MNKQVSFVIPHMGREQMLTDTLSSIAQQSFELALIEVLVVTKNTELSTQIIAFENRFDLQILYAEPSVTISHQRNMGAANAQGEYFAFLDADVYLDSNWLSAMLSKLKTHPDINLISAIQKNSQDAPPLEQLRTALSNAAIDCEVEFLPGRNLLLHRDSFKRSGGFPEHLLTCEDYVFTQRVAASGKLFYSSDSHYVHIGEDKAFWAMAKKEVWRGQSNIASLKGRDIPLSEWPSFIAPPAFTFGIIIALLSMLFGLHALAALSILGSLLVIGAYTFRLNRITKGSPNLAIVAMFYLLYFPARTMGTIKGIFTSKA